MLVAKPDLFEEARLLHQSGDIAGAIAGYRQLLANQAHPHAPYLLGVALIQSGQEAEALEPLETMRRQRPGHAPTWCALGEALGGLERYEESHVAYAHALQLDANSLPAARGSAAILELEGDWEALAVFADEAADKHPDDAEILRFRIRALKEMNRAPEAMLLCVRFLVEYPGQADALRYFEDLFHLIRTPGDDLLALMDTLPDARGQTLYIRALARRKDPAGAIAAFQRLGRLHPTQTLLKAENLGFILQGEDLAGAAEPFLRAEAEKAPLDDARLRRLIENLLLQAKNETPRKFDEARDLARILLQRNPDDPDALTTMGNVLMGASRPQLALPYYDRLIEKNPDHPLRASRLFSLNYDDARSPEEIFEAHRSWGERFEEANPVMDEPFENDRDPERRLRIAYLSPDLGYHPVGTFFINIFPQHDSAAVEVFLYSNRYAQDGDDPRSQEFRRIAGEDHWLWTRGLSAERLARRIRRDRIDILIDLAGHTSHSRLDVLARRAAPVQVSWLGYANTTGLTRVDYRFSDAIVEPPGEADQRSTEEIYRLPNGFHVFALPAHTPEVASPPCLKRGYVTFGTYNNMNKLGAASVELWARLLKKTPGSRILIKHSTLAVLDNRESLRSLFAMHGIQAWRVDLRETTAGHQEHLRSYEEIDIALDPLSYNGTTTTCDALTMGVPVLTLPGRTHASRVSASLMHRVGLDGWVARDEEHFIEIGALAAQNPEALAQLRQDLRARFLASPLSDGASMARDLEFAYRRMWRRWCEAVSTDPHTPKADKL
ncbi:tetratricopeptide repeat protein [Ruficoccus amylovorans]|uniref:protein O-GlcNAc transferase n=1 Tax=Ruficoccus amylovorans TaxID=1804625 RepID=A0A842HHK1_9BACT|nr:tetratricopeptide repeat protein [Ruficoccus amylovorans]MBC2595044.1 tetratricopeptide repeat protein [Ruficoccus amylovorans]